MKPSCVQAIACVRNASLLTLVANRHIHASELFGRVLLCFAQAEVESLFATHSSFAQSSGDCDSRRRQCARSEAR